VTKEETKKRVVWQFIGINYKIKKDEIEKDNKNITDKTTIKKNIKLNIVKIKIKFIEKME
jgi:hypothetical protein